MKIVIDSLSRICDNSFMTIVKSDFVRKGADSFTKIVERDRERERETEPFIPPTTGLKARLQRTILKILKKV